MEQIKFTTKLEFDGTYLQSKHTITGVLLEFAPKIKFYVYKFDGETLIKSFGGTYNQLDFSRGYGKVRYNMTNELTNLDDVTIVKPVLTYKDKEITLPTLYIGIEV